MNIVWLAIGSMLAAQACQPPCHCRELEHPKTAAIAAEPPADAPHAAGPPSSAAPAPLGETPPLPPSPEEDSPGMPPKRGTAIHGRGFIEIEEAGQVRRVEGPCDN